MIRIMFVCHGNICRSPMAEFIMKKLVADAGLSGLEFASGIPGTVGGGVTMNAGAYDGEMAQVVTEVRGLYPDGKAVCLTREEMDFGYRHSAVAEKGIIERVSDRRTDHQEVGSLRVKIEQDFGIGGILPVLVLLGCVFRALDLVLLYCLFYYGGSCMMVTISYIRKARKAEKRG